MTVDLLLVLGTAVPARRLVRDAAEVKVTAPATRQPPEPLPLDPPQRKAAGSDEARTVTVRASSAS